MSDVPRARAIIEELLNDCERMRDVLDDIRSRAQFALAHMTREPAVRCAKRTRHVRITEELIREVISLAHNSPDMTIHDIADKVGLRNSGRVSEILTGKRDADSSNL